MGKLYSISTVVCFGALLFIGACTSTPPAGRVAVDTYAHLSPVDVNVASIEIYDDYIPPMTGPNIEHEMINPPYRAAYNMINNAFKSTSPNNTLEFHIRDGSVKMERIADNQSSFKIWQRQTLRKYTGRLHLDIVLLKSVPPYEQIGAGTVKVRREMTTPESLSVAEREEAINQMSENMISDLRQGIRDVLDKKLNLL